MDMTIHLLTVLKNFEKAGLAEYIPSGLLPAPQHWEYRELLFRSGPDQTAKTILLRRQDTLVMLPLIGLGSWYTKQAYMPYPAICGTVEGSPEGALPFLIPEYTLADGRTARPIQYYDTVECHRDGELVTVIARGHLCNMAGKLPEKCSEAFTARYCFDCNRIEAAFTVDPSSSSDPSDASDSAYRSCRMLLGTHTDDTLLLPVGFTSCESYPHEEAREFCTPHGAITRAYMAETAQNGTVGYQILLNR